MIGRLRNALGGVSSPISPPLESASRDIFSPVFKRSHGLWRSRQAELTVSGRLSLYKNPSEVKSYDVNSPKKLIIGAGKTSLHVKIVTKEGQKLYLKVKGNDRDQWANRMMEFKFPKEDSDGDTTVDTLDSEMERSLLSGRQANLGGTPFPKRKSIGSPVTNFNDAASETSFDVEEKFVMLGEGLPLTKSQEVMDLLGERETVLDLSVVELPLEDEEGLDKKKFDLSPVIQTRMGMTADGRTFFPKENDIGLCVIDENAGHTPFPKRRSILPLERQADLSDSETEVEMTNIPETVVDPLMTLRSETEKYFAPLSPLLHGVQDELDDSDYDDETELLDEEFCEDVTTVKELGVQQEPLEVVEEKVEEPKLEIKKVDEEVVVPKQKAGTWGRGHVAKMAEIFNRTIRAGTNVIDPDELAKAGL